MDKKISLWENLSTHYTQPWFQHEHAFYNRYYAEQKSNLPAWEEDRMTLYKLAWMKFVECYKLFPNESFDVLYEKSIGRYREEIPIVPPKPVFKPAIERRVTRSMTKFKL